MKNILYAGAVLASVFWLAAPASATLVGDEITGTATGLTTFSSGTVTVVDDFDPEFVGTLDLYGDNSVVFDTRFMFFEDSMTIYIEHHLSGSTQFMTDFSVTFTDLDFVGFPTFVLTDVTSDYDSLGTGAGLAVSFTEDSLLLDFTNFQISESRRLELGLVFEDENPVTPVPEPATAVLVAIGAGTLALARRRRA